VPGQPIAEPEMSVGLPIASGEIAAHWGCVLPHKFPAVTQTFQGNAPAGTEVKVIATFGKADV